jgi:predicted nucleotidyltransferase
MPESDSAHLKEIEGLLAEIVEKYREIIGDRLAEVVLFGSYAKGRQEKYSDIDIMALVNDSDERIREYDRNLEEVNYEITMKYEVLVSCVVISSIRFEEYRGLLPFFINVEKEGIPIYERPAA